MRNTRFDALHAGTFDAIADSIRNNTTTPTGDFFFAVKEGVREAIENIFANADARSALIEAVVRGLEK